MALTRANRRRNDDNDDDNNNTTNTNKSSTVNVNVYVRRIKKPRTLAESAPAGPSSEAVAVDSSKSKGKEIASHDSEDEDEMNWSKLTFVGVDPKTFIGLKCKVFWPEDKEWYRGCVVGYSPKTKKHRVDYDDGDMERLVLSKEIIKFEVPAASKEDNEECPKPTGVKN